MAKKKQKRIPEIYHPDDFDDLYSRFITYYKEYDTWTKLEAGAYIVFMSLNLGNMSFPIDLFRITNFIIPKEYQSEFVKKFITCLLNETKNNRKHYKEMVSDILSANGNGFKFIERKESKNV